MSVFADWLKTFIAQEGPISVERYMELCLSHPLGYYATRDPFGETGDFITSPEISQIFGELLGIFAIATWQSMGEPQSLTLIELGPGRGTLMSDALRIVRRCEPLWRGLEVHLVEISPVLRQYQQERLISSFAVPIHWHDSIATLPGGHCFLLANEFFDAFPVRHFIKGYQGWHERQIGFDGETLDFGLSPDPEPHMTVQASEGDILEIAPRRNSLVQQLASHVLAHKGVLLIMDYGYGEPTFGDTFQAVKAHQYVDVLENPGEADLTAHVDFSALAKAAAQTGAAVSRLVSQRDFLLAMGIEARAAQLCDKADALQQNKIRLGVERLISDAEPTDMGALFKVLSISHPSLHPLPGFS
jgi:NADH dehydrogenase [ubiquinone] 1 alpha subcomplex assembly factor 7